MLVSPAEGRSFLAEAQRSFSAKLDAAGLQEGVSNLANPGAAMLCAHEPCESRLSPNHNTSGVWRLDRVPLTKL